MGEGSELTEAVDRLAAWKDGAALILSGDGGHFCAGLDFELAKGELSTPENGELMSMLMTDNLNRLRSLPLLSVAAVDGAGFGGGAELATACDWRVMAADARLRFVQAKMGATTGWGGSARLVELVGRRQALRLLTLSPTVDTYAATAT